MTKKDYAAIAAVFKTAAKDFQSKDWPLGPCYHFEEGYRYEWEYLRNGIADVFAADNPRFSREKFYKACEGN